jgi:TadE-like protein
MAAIKKILAGDRASEIAEAALVLPLAFMILLGIYWFGRAFNVYATINHAAREGARVAVAQTCATCGNAPPNAINVADAVTQALKASSVDPNQITPYLPALSSCSGTVLNCSVHSKMNICTNVWVQNPPNTATGLGPQACGVAIVFQYPYRFPLPFTSLNNQTIMLTADVQMAGEY